MRELAWHGMHHAGRDNMTVEEEAKGPVIVSCAHFYQMDGGPTGCCFDQIQVAELNNLALQFQQVVNLTSRQVIYEYSIFYKH